MPTVCDILRKHEDRFAAIEAKLAGINLFDNMGDAKLIGSQWEVGGDMIAVWSPLTNRPLSWAQGQWARLTAGKVEARGVAFDFRSSDAGARVVINSSGIELYDATPVRTVWLDAATGNATFTGTIHAAAGDIGGWTITADELHNADIWLDATAKQIAIGDQTWGNAGIQLEFNAGAPRMYVGDGANEFLEFDGAVLTWKATNTELDAAGNLTATSVTLTGSITATAGAIAGWDIGATTFQKLAGTVGIILDSSIPAIKVGDTAAVYIYVDGASEQIGVSNFSAGVRGWRIEASGDAEFNNITARGTIRTPVFLKDEVFAIGGSFLVAETDALIADCTTAALINGAFTFHTAKNYFAVNDVVRCKPDVGREFWAFITGIAGASPDYTYTADLKAGDTATIFYTGEAIVNYGGAGQGLILLTASLANAPYLSIFNHAAAPWAGITEHVRLGNLVGINDPLFGALGGYGIWTDQGYFTGSIKATAGELQTLTITGFLLLSGAGTIWTSAGLPSIKFDAAGMTAYDAGADVVSTLDAATGKFWSKLGGFGGTFAAPAILLSAAGLATAAAGPRIELTAALFVGYDGADVAQFWVDATTGAAYFAGGNAIMDEDGIIISDELSISWDSTMTANVYIAGLRIDIESNPAANSLTCYLGIDSRPVIKAGNIRTHNLLEGANLSPRHGGTGALTTLIGCYSTPRNLSTAIVDHASSFYAYGKNENAGGTITTYTAFRSIMANAGTITTGYGLFLGALGATNSYGIWQDGVDELNVFKGIVQVDEPSYFDGLWKGKRHYISQNTGQTCAAGWAWADVTGATVNWTSHTTEDIVILLRSAWNRNGAGAADFYNLRWDLDGAVQHECLRATWENDDWPMRSVIDHWENVAAGNHTLHLEFRGASVNGKIQHQYAMILRMKH